ncbi:hypothetical protein CDL15_Pgr014975 [Punica granatum]|uniref:Uncharacterized protein n=1 Tax=Punica granatum TaxID=22663 RepID=A0A218X054_PUNGR|nr:hypothetical protein CDL15_Pgr014975 [Punica granatum]
MELYLWAEVEEVEERDEDDRVLVMKMKMRWRDDGRWRKMMVKETKRGRESREIVMFGGCGHGGGCRR